MSKIEIIPAIDIIDGKCVRLSQGDYNQSKVYEMDPVEMALRFSDIGVKRIHIVDLDGAKSSSPRNLATLEKLCAVTDMKIEWGGGIKTDESLKQVMDSGATYAIVGSVAAKQPELFESWLSQYGGQKIVLGADVRAGKVSVNGWLEDMELTIEQLIDGFLPFGLQQVICTDITKDGMLQGPSDELYTGLQASYPQVVFTVSGGISSMDDIRRLDGFGLKRVIVGKAIYENRITLEEIEKWLQNA